MNTADIRAHQKNNRLNLSAELQHQHAEAITLSTCTQDFFTQSTHIAFYLPMFGEVDTWPLIALAREAGKQCYLPVLAPDDNKHLLFMPYEADTPLVNNRFNIPEPLLNPSLAFPVHELDLVFTPLVAFDARCHRVGMGAGFYDRTFAFLQDKPRPTKPLLCGLAYAFQEVDNTHPQDWDVSLDYVITEGKIFRR